MTTTPPQPPQADDGGCAFPFETDEMKMCQLRHVLMPTGQKIKHPGMSMRQWYAGMAMQGLLASPQEKADAAPIVSAGWYAAKSVALADALIAELKKPKP